MSLYEILGVKRDAPQPAIRKAYLKKAKQTHPDRGGNEAEFKEVSRAFGVLGNPRKRIEYDQTGKEDGAQTPEEAAVAIIRNLTEMVVANNADPANVDFLREMRSQIAQALANAANQSADISRKIARCKKLQQRFKRKSGDNLISKILQGRIDDMDRQIVAIGRDKINLVSAQEMLAAYEYQIDPVQAFNGYANQISAQAAFNAFAAQGQP